MGLEVGSSGIEIVVGGIEFVVNISLGLEGRLNALRMCITSVRSCEREYLLQENKSLREVISVFKPSSDGWQINGESRSDGDPNLSKCLLGV